MSGARMSSLTGLTDWSEAGLELATVGYEVTCLSSHGHVPTLAGLAAALLLGGS
jgi:hypothetical protein